MFGYGAGIPPWLQAIGAMAPGGGIGGGLPQVQAHNSPDDPRGLMNPRGGPGAPAMPMGDMPPLPARQPMSSENMGGGQGQSGMFANGLNGSQGIRDALATNAMQTPTKPFKGMFPGKDWKYALGTILPAAIEGYLAGSGNPAGMAMMQHRNRLKESQQEAEMRAKLPQQVGSSLVRQNGLGGYDTLYSEPSDAERYAANLGVAQGSPEWADAIREYRAPAYSPLAMEGKLGLEGARFGYRGALQEDRQQFSAGQQEDRQQHSSGLQEDRQSHTPPAKPAPAPKLPQSEGALYTDIMRRYTSGGTVNVREKEFVRSYEARNKSKGKGKGGLARPSASGSSEAIARDAQGNEYVVRGGKWVRK
jgi:hypothetical protein